MRWFNVLRSMGYFLKQTEIIVSRLLTHDKNITYELGDKLYIGSEVKKVESMDTIMKSKIKPKAKLDCPCENQNVKSISNLN